MTQTGLPNIAHSAVTPSGLESGSVAIDSTDANTADRYPLLPNKVYIEPCQREALRLHPGIIEKQRLVHRHGNFFMEYEIQARDGQVRLMQCDLTTGKIIDVF